MASQREVKVWTYTGGYPTTLHQSTVTISPRTNITNQATTIKDKLPLVVKIHAAALNPVDIQMQNLPSHKYSWSASYNTEKGTGCDFSGTVIEGGSTGFQKGDEVCGITLNPSQNSRSGSLGQIAEFDAAATIAVRKPRHWTFEQAAAVPLVWLTAKQCVESVASFVESTAEKKVAVLGGSSATGAYSILLAKKRGWKVVATSSGRNRDFVVDSLGADAHVDYTTSDVRTEISKFEPVAVIDCVGGTECIGLPSSKRYTTIVGDKTGRTSMGGPYTYYDIWAPVRAATQWFRWARGWAGLGESYDVIILGMRKEWLEEATTTLDAEQCFVDSVFSFDQVKEAFERLNTGRAKGKVVVKVV
nr:reticulon-4-interacting protein 1 like, mitochondrial [Quercus suber]